MRRFTSIVAASFLIHCVFLVHCPTAVMAGIYSGPSDTANSIDPAIAANDSRFVEWADVIDASRTLFGPRGSTSINQAGGVNSLGDLVADEIAAGALPGHLTVTFPNGIRNGAGHDFAVFENGFVFPSAPNLFAELAYVEVSTNGTDFARFSSLSTNTTWAGGLGQNFGGFDTTNIYNLAGKQAGGFGTPFDLDDLLTAPEVVGGAIDLGNIQFVRLVDIPGSGDFLDSEGNPILDAWLTEGSGGFDFRLGVGRGVGVINATAVPEPGGFAMAMVIATAIAAWRRRMRTNRVQTTPLSDECIAA